VEKAVRRFEVTYPVAIDSEYAIWKAFNNEYWPAALFHRRQGRIVITISGGRIRRIRACDSGTAQENGAKSLADGVINVSANGALGRPRQWQPRALLKHTSVITAPSISPRSSQSARIRKKSIRSSRGFL